MSTVDPNDAQVFELRQNRRVWQEAPPEVLESLPAHLREGFQRYFERHERPGAFLCAFLANDLMQAVMRADPVSFQHLQVMAQVVFTWAPAYAVGSWQVVDAWTADEPGWAAACAVVDALEAEAVIAGLARLPEMGAKRG